MAVSSIAKLKQLINEVEVLKNVPEDKLVQPIAQGKWSTREIIGHIVYWDKYILENMVPAMKDDGVLPNFPDDDEFNAEAIEKLASTSTIEILDRFMIGRELLVAGLAEIDPNNQFTFPGSTKKYTAESFSSMFVSHDELHLKQINNVIE